MKPTTQKECKKLLQMKGKVRGVILQTDINYVLQKKGKAGVNKLEERFRKLGVSVDFKKLRALNWYPLGWSILFGILALELFNWPDSEIEEMGKQAPKFSFMIRALAKYLLSPEKAFKAASKFWSKQISEGKARTVEFNEKEKYGIIQITGIKGHWIICIYVKGYLQTFLGFTLKTEKVKVEETKCPLRGDSYHEFKITWK